MDLRAGGAVSRSSEGQTPQEADRSAAWASPRKTMTHVLATLRADPSARAGRHPSMRVRSRQRIEATLGLLLDYGAVIRRCIRRTLCGECLDSTSSKLQTGNYGSTVYPLA